MSQYRSILPLISVRPVRETCEFGIGGAPRLTCRGVSNFLQDFTRRHVPRAAERPATSAIVVPADRRVDRCLHGSLETFGGPQRHAIAHLKAGKMVIPNMSSVMLGKSVLF